MSNTISDILLESLTKELQTVESKLDALLSKGGNDEKLVDERRRLQQSIREYTINNI